MVTGITRLEVLVEGVDMKSHEAESTEADIRGASMEPGQAYTQDGERRPRTREEQCPKGKGKRNR